MANKIASAKNYTTILDAVYQREAATDRLSRRASWERRRDELWHT